MNIIEVAKMLGEFLKGETIYFDLASYSADAEPPFLIVDNKREIVESATLNKEGTFLVVEFANGGGAGFGFYEEDGLTIDDIEKECGEMGIYQLLKDMYYETDESFDIGDFEQDFLKLSWWDIS
jgi:hypothetical protein